MKRSAGPMLIILSLLTDAASANSQLICSHQPITALAGDDVILPCHLEPPISVSDETVVWTRPDLDPKYIHVHQDGRFMFENQNPSYNFRTRVFVDELMTGNVSMKIFKVKVSDTGRYQCALPSLQKEASIQLIVGESDVIGSDKPVTVTVGDNAILPCHLEPPFNVRTLTVEWTHDGEYVHVSRHGKDYLTDQDENFRNRTSVFYEEMIRGNISLKLTNVTELDAGSYTCNVPKLQSQVRRGFINLTVEPMGGQTGDISRSTGISTGAITGIALGVIAVIAIVAVAVSKNRRKITTDCATRNTTGRNGQNREGSQEDNAEDNTEDNTEDNAEDNVEDNDADNAEDSDGDSDGGNGENIGMLNLRNVS
ncbi:CD276 antigen-like isoform X3 [Dicentrarchus labrax]|uniref:CD276 antigen-like isoform X3 n=1 Tax=Dicentrarchus labrax TaxID=13489 RepID=UPI0021F58888|nr:CD276 antigen-like isoform X3 [Dicentrarchus labrax]